MKDQKANSLGFEGQPTSLAATLSCCCDAEEVIESIKTSGRLCGNKTSLMDTDTCFSYNVLCHWDYPFDIFNHSGM
jgi:hypothetical protein